MEQAPLCDCLGVLVVFLNEEPITNLMVSLGTTCKVGFSESKAFILLLSREELG